MSACRGFAQIPSRSRNLVCYFSSASAATAGHTESDITTALAAFRAANPSVNYSFSGSVLSTDTQTNLALLYSYFIDSVNGVAQTGDVPNVGDEYRDMGKEIRFTVNGRVVQIWTKVQLITGGSGSEGVPSTFETTGQFYLPTYCAPTPIAVRTATAPWEAAVVARLG
jgi:hypothetical protein